MLQNPDPVIKGEQRREEYPQQRALRLAQMAIGIHILVGLEYRLRSPF